MFQLQGAEWLVVLSVGGLIVSLVIAPLFVAKAARDKGRSYGAWYAITAVLGVSLCFVGWIIPAIIVATMKPEASDHATAPPGSASTAPPRPTKRCPACADDVLADARRCKHCGQDLTDAMALAPLPTSKTEEGPRSPRDQMPFPLEGVNSTVTTDDDRCERGHGDHHPPIATGEAP